MTRRLSAVFGLDLRSLALLRVGLGLLLLYDLATRATDLVAHYTDAGVLPRAARGALDDARAAWTLHALASGHPAAVAALFGLAALAAVALLLGWHTRAATAASWLLLASLQWRHPGLNYGGDVMLRLLLFWSLFLPLDARFSLAARRRAGPAPSDVHLSVASGALLVQLCLVYWMTVLHRAGSEWWEGRALWYVLHYDQFVTGFGAWLRGFEAALPALTWGALALEIVGPFAMLAPAALAPGAGAIVRTATVAAFVAFHLALGAMVDLGIFPVAFSLAWLVWLPGAFWDRVAPATRTGGGAPPPPSRAAQAAAAAALAIVLLWNLDTLDGAVGRVLPRGWDAPARALTLDQRWSLIAPPPRYDGWYVFEGHTAAGDRVDPFHAGETPTWEKPARVSARFDARWRHYLFDLALQGADPRWARLGDYLCRHWNEAHAGDDRLVRLNLYFVRETTLPSGPERGETLVLHSGECPAG